MSVKTSLHRASWVFSKASCCFLPIRMWMCASVLSLGSAQLAAALSKDAAYFSLVHAAVQSAQGLKSWPRALASLGSGAPLWGSLPSMVYVLPARHRHRCQVVGFTQSGMMHACSFTSPLTNRSPVLLSCGQAGFDGKPTNEGCQMADLLHRCR